MFQVISNFKILLLFIVSGHYVFIIVKISKQFCLLIVTRAHCSVDLWKLAIMTFEQLMTKLCVLTQDLASSKCWKYFRCAVGMQQFGVLMNLQSRLGVIFVENCHSCVFVSLYYVMHAIFNTKGSTQTPN